MTFTLLASSFSLNREKRSGKYCAKTQTLVENLYRTFSPYKGRYRQAEG